jgi:hypothetical protein
MATTFGSPLTSQAGAVAEGDTNLVRLDDQARLADSLRQHVLVEVALHEMLGQVAVDLSVQEAMTPFLFIRTGDGVVQLPQLAQAFFRQLVSLFPRRHGSLQVDVWLIADEHP